MKRKRGSETEQADHNVKSGPSTTHDTANFSMQERQDWHRSVRSAKSHLSCQDGAQFFEKGVATVIDVVLPHPIAKERKSSKHTFELANTAAAAFCRLGNEAIRDELYDKLFDTLLLNSRECFTQKQTDQILAFKNRNFHTLQKQWNNPAENDGVEKRVKMAETVLQRRTGRILVVLDSSEIRNEVAALRSAECLGIQNVWVIFSKTDANLSDFGSKGSITRGNQKYLTCRKFSSAKDCLEALKQEGREIWVTLPMSAADSTSLDTPGLKLPEKLAVVIADHDDACQARPFGFTPEMLAAAHKRVHLAVSGFTDSFSISIGAALIMNQFIHMCPEARGDLPEEQKKQLRSKWFDHLASNDRQRALYSKYVEQPTEILEDLRKPDHHKISSTFAPKKMMDRIKMKEELVAKQVELERQAATTTTAPTVPGSDVPTGNATTTSNQST